MATRSTAALDDRTTAESGVILLPADPIGTARIFLEDVAADRLEVELICAHCEMFRQERLT